VACVLCAVQNETELGLGYRLRNTSSSFYNNIQVFTQGSEIS
jgi:hypothetical protein